MVFPEGGTEVHMQLHVDTFICFESGQGCS